MWMNAAEKNEFQRRQQRQAEQYRRAGMSREQIRAMAEYDRAEFLSERRYRSHTQPLSPSGEAEADRALMLAYPAALTVTLEEQTALGWTEELGEELAAKVRALTPGQRELIGQLIYEGWTQEAVARMRGVDRRSVGRMWRRAVERLR